MIKTIPIEQLRVGMYVHHLGCSWLDHPFLRKSFPLESERDLQRIREIGLSEVLIDTTRGLDVQDPDLPPAAEARVVTPAPTHAPSPPSPSPPHPPAPQSFSQELGVARKLHHEAVGVVQHLMRDIRLGKQVETEKLEPVVERITDSILRNPDALISLGRIKQKDTYTFQHSVNVCALLVSFARSLGFEMDRVREMGVGGLLHDFGKMRVPDEILNKPGRLTEEEFAVMRGHVALGVEVLAETPGLPPTAVEVAGLHHERCDGSGYPNALKEDDIPQVGRMAAIVDVYDAITSDRCYHKGMEPTAAMRRMFELGGNHFDTNLVERFIRTIGIYPVGALVALASGFVGVVAEQNRADLLHPIVRLFYDQNRQRSFGPRTVDLSDESERNRFGRIVRHESAEEWNIDPLVYL